MLDRISEWGEKVAEWVGERTQFGSNKKVKEEDWQHLFDFTSLASLLHYEAYDPKTNLFYNKKSQGFVLEGTTLIGASEQTTNLITRVITDLSNDVDFQFLLWGSDKIGDLLDYFENSSGNASEIFKVLAKKKTDYLKTGAYRSLISNGTQLVRDFRLFIVISITTKKNEDKSAQLIKIRESLVSSLRSINLLTRNVDADELLSIVSSLLHPNNNPYLKRERANPYNSLSDQMVNTDSNIRVFKDHLAFNNQWRACAYSVKSFPEYMMQSDMEDAIGQLYNNAKQIPCPFLISLSLRTQDLDKTSWVTRLKSFDTEKSARVNQELLEKSFELKTMQKNLKSGETLVKTFFQVILFSKEAESIAAENNLINLYDANRWELQKINYLHLQSFLAALPMRMSEGMYQDLNAFSRLYTMTAFNAANIAPLQGEWKGSKTPVLLLLGRRGQICLFSPFDNDQGNYNLVIAAASGSGKSFFAQAYVEGLRRLNGIVWVIDIGRSFEKTCRTLNGTFIDFKPNIDICINPFTYIENFSESLSLLKPLLAAMARNSSTVSDEEYVYLEQAINAAWLEKGRDATITTVSLWLAKQSSPYCQNLSLLLYSYTKDGMYGHYFEGKANIDLSNPFVVLELQLIESNKDLMRIVLMVLMFQIKQAMYSGENTRPKTLILDEFWRYFTGEKTSNSMALFVAEFARTVRKHTGSLVTIVQSINDYFRDPSAIATYENSDYQTILRQNNETLEKLIENKNLSINPYSEKLYRSLVKTDEYSECIIKGPSGLSVHRLILDPFTRILYTSKGKDFDAVRAYEEQGLSLINAIEQVSKDVANDR